MGKDALILGFLEFARHAPTIPEKGSVEEVDGSTVLSGKESDVRLFRSALWVVLAIGCVSTASAQYGLYGAPETLRIPPTNVQQSGAAQNGVVPTNYPDTGSIQQLPAPPGAPIGYEPPPVPAGSAPIIGPAPRPVPATAAPCETCGPYRPALENFERAACGPPADACGSNGCCPWYASLSGLVLGRSESRRLWTSYKMGEDTDQLTNSQFGMQWKWGGEVVFGRRFCWDCVPCAIEAKYWSTEAFYGMQSTVNPDGTVGTPLIVKPLMFGDDSAENWFDGAKEHRLWRRDEFHDIEVNLIRQQLTWGCGSPWDVGWSVGVRYFRFRENLTFGSLMSGHQWGEEGGMYEGYFSDTIANNLIGPQFGFQAAYNLGSGVRLFCTPSVGVYANIMDGSFEAHTGDGVNGRGPYGFYPIHATKGGVAFLTQIDVGADWQISRNWGLRVGYRAVAMTGMALADDQFPQYMVDTLDVSDIQPTGSLLLHGAFAGVTYNF
jgi:hypothetical protein